MMRVRSGTYLAPPRVDDSQMVVMVYTSLMQLLEARFCRCSFATVLLHLAIYGSFRIGLRVLVSMTFDAGGSWNKWQRGSSN